MTSAEYTELFAQPVGDGANNAHAASLADTCNRYQCKSLDDSNAGAKTNWLLKCEVDLAAYFGHSFGIGVNSGGMAIMLGLKAMHRVLLKHAEKCAVYSNSFTFNAVPSAIVNAGFSPTFIQTTPLLTIDAEDLERQVKADLEAGVPEGNMILVLSYMRGRIPNMDRIMEICAKYQVHLLEDNAHGYGAEWNGRKMGSFGVVSTISAQANKLINTGEGGFIFTSDHYMQAFFMFSAGCYEELYKKHETMCPSSEAIEEMRFSVSNWSCRLSNIQAALAYPQIAILPTRIAAHNSNYYKLQKLVAERLGVALKSASSTGILKGELDPQKLVEFIPQLPEVFPVYDSVQMRVDLPSTALASFISSMNSMSFKLQLFADKFNARYYRSWKYCVSEDERFTSTDAVLEGVVDMRLLCHDTAKDVEKQADAITTCFLQAAHLTLGVPDSVGYVAGA
jgi:dTDP-4-amino-4,6-dideoxygalactose transaminase